MGLCVLFLSFGLILALSYALIINKFISIAGSVFFTLIGNVKFILIIILSYYIFHDKLTLINLIGVLITFAGFILYSYFRDLDNEVDNEGKDINNKIRKMAMTEKKIQYDIFQDDDSNYNNENEFLLTTNEHSRYKDITLDNDDANKNTNNKRENQTHTHTLNYNIFRFEMFLSIFVIFTVCSFLFSSNQKHVLVLQSQQHKTGNVTVNVPNMSGF
jgi:hypothetical protein